MHGAQVTVIVGRNTIFPKEVVESIVGAIEKMPKSQNNKVQTKMVEKVVVALYISDDEQAAVMFPNARGEIDMSSIFIGNDPAFYEWCNDLFDYYWNRAGYFDIKKDHGSIT